VWMPSSTNNFVNLSAWRKSCANNEMSDRIGTKRDPGLRLVMARKSSSRSYDGASDRQKQRRFRLVGEEKPCIISN
jgi:hypothetical protein